MAIQLSERLKRFYPNLSFSEPGGKLESVCSADRQPCLSRENDVATSPDDPNTIIRVHGAPADRCNECYRNFVK